MAEIQDKNAEIVAMAKLAVLLKEDIAEKDAEIERLKALVIRAADALERIEVCQHWQWTIDLAKELRKATQ